jgi:hypothetical protein
MPLLRILQMADKIHGSALTGEYIVRSVIFAKGSSQALSGA